MGQSAGRPADAPSLRAPGWSASDRPTWRRVCRGRPCAWGRNGVKAARPWGAAARPQGAQTPPPPPQAGPPAARRSRHTGHRRGVGAGRSDGRCGCAHAAGPQAEPCFLAQRRARFPAECRLGPVSARLLCAPWRGMSAPPGPGLQCWLMLAIQPFSRFTENTVGLSLFGPKPNERSLESFLLSGVVVRGLPGVSRLVSDGTV